MTIPPSRTRPGSALPFATLLCVATSAAHGAPISLVDDPLRGKTLGRLEGEGHLLPGGGFRSRGGRIVYDTGRLIERGSFEVTLSELRFPAQGALKSNVLSAWEHWPDAFSGSFLHWRFGREDALKVMAAPDGAATRMEHGLGPAVYGRLNDGKPHRYRAEWKDGRVDFFIDGTHVHGMALRRLGVRYFTVGVDPSGAGARLTDPAPVATNVVIVDRGEPLPPGLAATAQIPQQGLFEQSLRHTGKHRNPYREVTAVATVVRHNGPGPRSVPLFWDGGNRWRLRFSPDSPGVWTWTVRSNDAGLEGKRGAFTCVRSANRGGVVATAQELQRERNGEFWLLGDTLWPAFATDRGRGLDRASVARFVESRARRRFSYLQADLLWPERNEGGPPFRDLRAEALNPSFFQEVDRRIQGMNGNDILVMLNLAWTRPRSGSEPGPTRTWRDFPSDDARLRFARYVAARYGALNVAFSAAAGWDPAHGEAETASIRALARELAKTDTHRRLVTVLPASGGVAESFGKEPWFTLGDVRTNEPRIHDRQIEAAQAINRPRLQTLHLRNDGGNDLDAFRHATWDAVMSGAYPVAAFASTELGGLGRTGAFNPERPEDDPALRALAIVRDFFVEILPKGNPRGGWHWLKVIDRERGRPLTAAVRVEGEPLAQGHPQPHDGRPPGQAVRLMAKLGFGFTGVLYVRGSTKTHVIPNLDEHHDDPRGPVPHYETKRFDPRTGEYASAGEHRGKDGIAVTPPDARDWVFTARRTNPWRPPDWVAEGQWSARAGREARR